MAKPKRIIMMYDLVNSGDPQDRTYKETNLGKKHKFPIGSLVEIGNDAGYDWEWASVRLYVCEHARDCDGMPLYSLGNDGCMRTDEMHHGFSEDCLTLIRCNDKDGEAIS
jgi:hypothetical protein